MDSWPNSARLVHLHGGLFASNPPKSNKVTIWPNSTSDEICQIEIPTYTRLFSALKELGLEPIGTEFITHEHQATGAMPMEWRTNSNQEKMWANWDASTLWSQLATSAFHHKNGFCHNLSVKINYQLSSINESLRDISYSYRNQLNSLILQASPEDRTRFRDGFTDTIYQKLHSFLYEAGILRDYLCEYVYNFSKNEKIRNEHEITTSSGLLKRLKKLEHKEDIESEFLAIMTNDGWLKELGEYRDLAMHYAPILIANKELSCIQQKICITNEKHIRKIRLPLPANPENSRKDRASLDNFDLYAHTIKSISHTSNTEYGAYDCLEYAQMIVTKLSNLAINTASLSPYKPMINIFIKTNHGIISGVQYIES